MKKKKVKVNKKRVFGLIAIIFLIGFIIFVGIKGSRKDDSETFYSKVEKIKIDELEAIIFTSGEVVSEEKRNLFFQVSGNLEELDIEIGDKIKKGAILANLNTDNLKDQIKTLELNIAIKEKQIKKLRMSGIVNYENAYKNAQINYIDALSTYNENEKLFNEGVISESQLSQFKKGLSLSLNNRDDAKKKYEGYGNGIDLEIYKLQLEDLKENLDNIKDDLNKAELISPIDGTITAINLKTGDFVQMNSPLIVLETTDNLLIETQISQYDINDIKVGQNVTITRSGDSEKFKGKVKKIYPIATSSGNSSVVTVEIEITDKSFYKPNFAVNVEILTDKSDNALLVPYGALLLDKNDNSYVFKVTEGKAKKVQVEKGISGALFIEIISSELEEGDNVIIDPKSDIKDGSVIEIIE